MDYKNIFIEKRTEFLNAIDNFMQAQNNVLQNIINSNKDSKFGKKHNFSKIKTLDDFQKNVPISDYEDYAEYIKEILDGRDNVLTTENIILLEPTGGSSGGSKFIPYTAALKQAFNKGLEPWLSDLFINNPGIVNNPMYWSITPASKIDIPPSNVIKIGFENDMEYFDSPFAEILSKQLMVPNVKNCDTKDFYRITLDELKKKKDLAFISIWNPTLLLNILDNVKNPSKLWKNLKVISCWDEGNSKIFAEKLAKLFPNTFIQGKGLLATEGIMTIPLYNIGTLPCVNSHFFEFISMNTGEIKTLNEIEVGETYQILLTTQGGLYRYNIGDVVRVYSKYKGCPLLSFVGRGNNISDYFGEKLHEQFVQSILHSAGIEINKKSEFYLFAPYVDNNEFCYTLYLQGSIKETNALSKLIETELQKNFHYKYARELKQISQFKIQNIKNGQRQYIDNCIRKGQKLGDIKQITFSGSTDWIFEKEEVV